MFSFDAQRILHLRTCLSLVLVALLWTPPAFAWERARTSLGIPVRWSSFPIPFFLGQDGCRDIPKGQEIPFIQQAFQTWELSCSRVSFAFQGLLPSPRAENSSDRTKNQNVIFWVEPPQPWDFPSDVLAITLLRPDPLTGDILDADILLNGHHFRWSIADLPPSGSHDLTNTLTHEIGHLLGLEHSSDPDATMFAQAPSAEIKKRDLAQDDRDAICSIYGKDPDAGLTFLVSRQDDGLAACPSLSPPLLPLSPPPLPLSLDPFLFLAASLLLRRLLLRSRSGKKASCVGGAALSPSR